MKKGYITLMTVLVVGAIATSVAVTMLALGVTASRSGVTALQAASARAAAYACAEEALEQIRTSGSYAGSGALTFSNASCSYTVIGGTSTTTQATGTAGTIVRKVKVVVTSLNPLLTASFYGEVADF